MLINGSVRCVPCRRWGFRCECGEFFLTADYADHADAEDSDRAFYPRHPRNPRLRSVPYCISGCKCPSRSSHFSMLSSRRCCRAGLTLPFCKPESLSCTSESVFHRRDSTVELQPDFL